MKILIFNFEYPPLGGGGGIATKELAEELAKRHAVHIITSWHPGLPVHEITAGVVIHRVKVIPRRHLPTATVMSMVAFVPMALWHGEKLLRDESFDVINSQFVVPSGLPAACLARWWRIPLVVSFVGGDLYDPTKNLSPHRHWWLRSLIRVVSKQATQATAISEDTKRRANELHGVTLPITVAHLGLVRQKVTKVSRQELGLPENAVIFVSIGRLIARKGLAQLLAAWQKINSGYLVIIGDGPLLTELRELAKTYDISDRVLFTGYVNNKKKQQILQVADGYVSASLHEGFGIVFLEAMAAGLPIVAFAMGGQCDFLRHHTNALLAAPDNQADFEHLLKRLVADRPLRESIGLANKEAVKEFYIEKTAVIFENVLKQASRHADRL